MWSLQDIGKIKLDLTVICFTFNKHNSTLEVKDKI